MIAQCGAYRCPRPLEPVSPVGIAGRTIVMLPKGMEDIAVCEQHPDFLREALPDHVVDPMFAIKAHTCFSHLTIVAALMPMLNCGSFTSVGMSGSNDFADGSGDGFDARIEASFQAGRKGNEHVWRGDAARRGLELAEAFFRHGRD